MRPTLSPAGEPRAPVHATFTPKIYTKRGLQLGGEFRYLEPKFNGGWRYAEYAYRRGLTKGCAGTDDVSRKFCPNDILQRYQAAAFIIRAKMNNVFPTVLSGCPASSPACADIGDNFGLFFGNNSYFTDVDPATSPYFPYISKMREMRIANGTSSTKFSPDDTLTRGQIAVFMVRAFFQ